MAHNVFLNRYCFAIVLLLIVSFILLSACRGGNDSDGKKKVLTEQSRLDKSVEKRSLANPAAVKCIDDGYELVPIMENGIQIGHRCRNPETGMTCEIWQYFRGECSLKLQ